MSPTRVAKLQKKAQYCHTCCSNLQGDCTGADQVERRADILGRQGQVATPAAFYLGLCRLRGNLSLPAPATVILQAGNSSMRLRTLQAGHSILRQRASEAGYSTCRDDCCRRNCNTLRRRKLESDAAPLRQRLRRRAILLAGTMALQ